MKILMTPITVLAHFEENGTPHPLRFKLDDDAIRIEHVVSVTEEKLAGNKMLCFRCQSEIDGVIGSPIIPPVALSTKPFASFGTSNATEPDTVIPGLIFFRKKLSSLALVEDIIAVCASVESENSRP